MCADMCECVVVCASACVHVCIRPCVVWLCVRVRDCIVRVYVCVNHVGSVCGNTRKICNTYVVSFLRNHFSCPNSMGLHL